MRAWRSGDRVSSARPGESHSLRRGDLEAFLFFDCRRFSGTSQLGRGGDLWLLPCLQYGHWDRDRRRIPWPQREGTSGLWPLTPLRSCSFLRCFSHPFPALSQVRAILRPLSGQPVGRAAFSVKCVSTAASLSLPPSPLFPAHNTWFSERAPYIVVQVSEGMCLPSWFC